MTNNNMCDYVCCSKYNRFFTFLLWERDHCPSKTVVPRLVGEAWGTWKDMKSINPLVLDQAGSVVLSPVSAVICPLDESSTLSGSPSMVNTEP